MSVPNMQKSGLSIIFNNQSVVVHRRFNEKPLNNLIIVNFLVKSGIITTPSKLINFEIWHRRLGYIEKNRFLELKSKYMVDDVKILPKDNLCEAYISSKQSQLSLNKKRIKFVLSDHSL